MTAVQVTPPDRLIVSVDDRRPALLDVIRQAKRRITLSLFRCNDPAVFQPIWESLSELIDSYPVVVAPDDTKFAP